MKLQPRERRALALLAAALLVLASIELYVRTRQVARAVEAGESAVALQKQLERVRRAAAGLPSREEAFKKAADELANSEKGLLQAETLPQAQAQLAQIARRVLSAQSPPIELRNIEAGQARPLNDDYGEVLLPVSFECRIEQLVNLLADVAAQPELLSVSAMRIGQGNRKEKTLNVRLTLAGVVPRKLIPEQKKGAGLL